MSPRDWPPLVVAADVPRWVRWRDFLLTLVMWIVFAWMLEREFVVFSARLLEWGGFGDFDTDARWPEFFELLRPFIRIAVVLIAALLVASALSIRRRRRSLLAPLPKPLEIAAEARHAGMTETDLSAARDLRIAVVHIEPDGRLRVEAR